MNQDYQYVPMGNQDYSQGYNYSYAPQHFQQQQQQQQQQQHAPAHYPTQQLQQHLGEIPENSEQDGAYFYDFLVCPFCSKSFTRSGHFDRHVRMHTGERPFPCLHPGCKKSFSRKDNMMQHYKCHTSGGYIAKREQKVSKYKKVNNGPSSRSMREVDPKSLVFLSNDNETLKNKNKSGKQVISNSKNVKKTESDNSLSSSPEVLANASSVALGLDAKSLSQFLLSSYSHLPPLHVRKLLTSSESSAIEEQTGKNDEQEVPIQMIPASSVVPLSGGSYFSEYAANPANIQHSLISPYPPATNMQEFEGSFEEDEEYGEDSLSSYDPPNDMIGYPISIPVTEEQQQQQQQQDITPSKMRNLRLDLSNALPSFREILESPLKEENSNNTNTDMYYQ